MVKLQKVSNFKAANVLNARSGWFESDVRWEANRSFEEISVGDNLELFHKQYPILGKGEPSKKLEVLEIKFNKTNILGVKVEQIGWIKVQVSDGSKLKVQPM